MLKDKSEAQKVQQRSFGVVVEQRGYALYIVVVLSFLLYMLIAHYTLMFVQQKQILQLQEMDIRTRVMVDSAVQVWLTAANQEVILEEIEVDHGYVNLIILNEDAHHWSLQVTSNLSYGQSRHQVQLIISKDPVFITSWRDL